MNLTPKLIWQSSPAQNENPFQYVWCGDGIMDPLLGLEVIIIKKNENNKQALNFNDLFTDKQMLLTLSY